MSKNKSWQTKKQQSGIESDLVVDYKETPLFPNQQIQPPHEITEQEERIYKIKKDFIKKLENGVFYKHEIVVEDEVQRYSDQFLRKEVKEFRNEIGTIRWNVEFFPSELQSILTKKRRVEKKERVDIDLDELERLAEGQVEEEEVEEEADELEEEEEENDYQIDYYDDDLDAIGNDSGGEDY